MTKKCAAYIVMGMISMLLITACGLQGDLYMPSEKPAATPADGQNAEDESTDEKESAESPRQAP